MKKSNKVKFGIFVMILALIFTVLMMPITVDNAYGATDVRVTSLSLNYNAYVIKKGSSVTLKAIASPSNAANKKVTWKSSNKKIATVSSSGKVVGKRSGIVTINAIAKDGSNKKTSIKVKVVSRLVNVSKISLSASKKSIYVGTTLTIKASIKPSSASLKTLKWTSSNSSIASVNQSGKVTGLKAGTVTITAMSQDKAKKKATYKIKVLPISSISVTDSITLNMYDRKPATLKVIVSPSNTITRKIKYSVADSSIVNVSSTGVVTPLKAGKTMITVAATDGSGKKDICQVTVNAVEKEWFDSKDGVHSYKLDDKATKYKFVDVSNISSREMTTVSNETVMSITDISAYFMFYGMPKNTADVAKMLTYGKNIFTLFGLDNVTVQDRDKNVVVSGNRNGVATNMVLEEVEVQKSKWADDSNGVTTEYCVINFTYNGQAQKLIIASNGNRIALCPANSFSISQIELKYNTFNEEFTLNVDQLFDTLLQEKIDSFIGFKNIRIINVYE